MGVVSPSAYKEPGYEANDVGIGELEATLLVVAVGVVLVDVTHVVDFSEAGSFPWHRKILFPLEVSHNEVLQLEGSIFGHFVDI